MHLWAQLHRQSLFGILDESIILLANNSLASAPAASLSTYACCCKPFSCNGAVDLRVCWCITMMVAITVIVIGKWNCHLDALNGLTMLILALGVTLGIRSCVTRAKQISGSTSLVLEVLCTFRNQLYKEYDIAAAFLPHQGQPLAQCQITFCHYPKYMCT